MKKIIRLKNKYIKNSMVIKIISYLILLIFSVNANVIISQEMVYYGLEANSKLKGTNILRYKKDFDLPQYVSFNENTHIDFNELNDWMYNNFKIDKNFGFKIISEETDAITNEKYYRCIQTYNDIPVFDATFVVHISNGRITTINGTLYKEINTVNELNINEREALNYAMKSTGAKSFMWQSQYEELALKEDSENPDATYFPKAELFYLKSEKNNEIYHLAWRFNIYASDTLLHEWIFVNATTGEILLKLSRIDNTDTPGVAVTKYSGSQNIVADSYNGTYRLRESGRGNGIRTYNMQEGKNYSNAVDFTDADNYWNNFNAQYDEVAGDAHWASEKYYDYLYNVHNRNSLDDAGFALLSYVHYDKLYANAFWDGYRMTYGDGDGSSWTPLTTVDIAGHEMTHGLTSYTCDLVYQNESGALNEGFSDIFGTALEFYAKPSSANWLLGEDIGSALRSLSNPKSYGLPDTYLGQYWYSGTGDNGGVHTNCGVLAHWFYLVAHGGSGTNDNNNSYNVTGIGISKAEKIAFRTLTVYLTSTSQYSDARFYSIQATTDLYGSCSQEVQTVTDAWYAVGIGTPYSADVVADFTSDKTIFCQTPAIVQFSNYSTNATSYKWDFGDGYTSTLKNPSHTYNSYGTFDIKLVAYGGSCGDDSITKTALINVNTQNPCSYVMPSSGTYNITSCNGILYDNGGTGTYINNTTSVVTIAPVGASALNLDFKIFDVEPGSGTSCDYDYLEIYNGSSTASPLIGRYCNTTGSPGVINTGGSATLKFYADQALALQGFEMHWTCTTPNLPPVADFGAKDITTCTGTINFYDLSSNGPTQWKWDFGDNSISNQQNPVHTYTSNGLYSVKLHVTNAFGYDSIIKTDYISVNMLSVPSTVDDLVCDSGILTLSATATSGNILWYDEPSGGNSIATGNIFTTPFLTNTVTYYAENIDTVNNIYTGGKPDKSGSGGNYNLNYIHYLVFSCTEPVVLKSVKVYSASTGNRTIYLRNASGSTIDSRTINIPSGESRITLDFNVPAGTGLQLAAQKYPNLYRNDGGTSYPYNIGDALTITGSSATSNPTDYYYYFYDWEIIETDTCFSPRVPVNATVVSLNPSIIPSGQVHICQNDSIELNAVANSNNAKYLWSPTNDTVSSIYVNLPGLYYFNTVDQNACSATSPSTEIILDTLSPSADYYYNINGVNVNFINTSTSALSYFWDFGDGDTSTFANPVHIYNKDSIYLVQLIAYNKCNSDTITDTVYYFITGIENYENENDLVHIFPNPVNETMFIYLVTPLSDKINISVFNVLGEKLIDETCITNAGFNEYHFNMKNFSSGILLVKIKTRDSIIIRKILSY